MTSPNACSRRAAAALPAGYFAGATASTEWSPAANPNSLSGYDGSSSIVTFSVPNVSLMVWRRRRGLVLS